MTFTYCLRDGSVADEATWQAKQGDAHYVQVEKTTLPNGCWISTLWLGIAPKLFETVVFDNATRQGLDRQTYATEAEARSGHQRLAEKWAGVG